MAEKYKRKATLEKLNTLDQQKFIDLFNSYSVEEIISQLNITRKVYELAVKEFGLCDKGKGFSTKRIHDQKHKELLENLSRTNIRDFYMDHSDTETIAYYNIHLKNKAYNQLLLDLGICRHSTQANRKLSKLNLYGNEQYINKQKTKNTIINNYGSWENYVDSRNEHIKATKLLRYGSETYNNHDKNVETRRSNGTLGISKMEEDYYNYLLSMYDKSDVLRQYKSERYPWHCDFYIISEDKFIECNYFWTHGSHPFDKNNQEDQERLSYLQSMSTNHPQYQAAIDTWTISDVAKRNHAKSNNLNYVEIY